MFPLHTRHTVLMQIKTSDGEATFLVAHPIIKAKTTTFKHTMFKNYPIGSLIVVLFKYSGSKRYVLRSNPYLKTDVNFKEEYGTTLANEAKAFISVYPEFATAFSVTIEKPAEKQVMKVEPKVASAFMLDFSSGLEGGRWLGEMYVKNSDAALFETSLKIAEDGASNLLIVGPSGAGKTSLPKEFSKLHDMKYLRMNCATIRDPEEWFGYREAVDGSTKFIPSKFIEAVIEGNVIIVLDEFNRVEPWLHNTLLPLLDHDRRTTVHNEEIVCGQNVLFVATINQGSRFTGTFVMDAALTNRFDAIIFADYLPVAIETKLLVDRTKINAVLASKVVKIMQALREFTTKREIEVDVSTRSSLKVAKLLTPGLLPLDLVISYVVLNAIDDESAVKGARDTIVPLL